MIQLYLPGVNIWLDGDSLEHLGDLEDSVYGTACFVLFYSKDYFKSVNCCREVAKAMERGNSITVIYEQDDTANEDVYTMQMECKKILPDICSTDDIVKYVFVENPTMWVSTCIGFTLESVKLVIGRLLKNLPYYEKYLALLNAGLHI